MKALVFDDIRQVTMGERPVPSPEPTDVLLHVRATGICGSDMAGFLGHSPRRRPPLILGHETVGTVERMPSAPPPNGESWPFKVGDRVVVNPLFPCGICDACNTAQTNICLDWRLLGMDKVEGAFAEYAVVPAANVFPVPDGLPDEKAIMIEPLANGVHLFRLISRHNFGSLVIVGAGTQGSLLLSLARMLGYRDIVMVDVNPARLEVSQTLGAKHLVNAKGMDSVQTAKAVRDALGGKGADIAIDAHGSQTSRTASVGSIRKGGEVLLLGLHEVESALDFTAIVRNEIRLQGSFTYTAEDFARAKSLIENGDIDLSSYTDVMPLESGQSAFDRLATDPGSTMKIVLTP